ncbi:MAG: methylmalonyl-CoA mutase family protein [bacterium]
MSKQDAYDSWRTERYEPFIAKRPERQERFSSSSGYETDPLAGPWADGRDYADSLGFPGEFPFTRGVQPNMYRGRFWTMRQYAGFSTARATNERYHFLLNSGQTGLSVAFDLPTQMGYDSTDPMALGEVGKVGVAIDTVEDMATLFAGIPQDRVTTSMTINAPATILLLMYQVVAEQQGIDPSQLGGTIQNDILKEYMARGTYIFPPQPSMLLTTDCFRYCTEKLPRWNTISISGYHIREAGCTAVQEVAFTLADGIEYTQQAINAGLDVDSFAGRLSFFFNSHNNFLEEVAKFRAARRLWARIMKDRFKAQDPKSMMMRFHTQTAGSMLTAQQPYNNIVRTTMQALSAVLGGTQSLHTNGFDEALALPTEQSAEIALRTQQIIAHESGVADTVDPLGGSWFIEDLTDRIETEAMAYIAKIDELGGMAAAVERGYPQAEIQQGAYEWQRSVETKDRVIVGVNEFRSSEEAPFEINRDDAAEHEQRERLEQYIARRNANPAQYGGGAGGDSAPWQSACGRLHEHAAAGAKSGYLELIREALLAGATEGEIVKSLESVWGRYQPNL